MQLLKIEKRKGISPLIATLLLIAIAVAASVLTYSWVMSMIGSQSAQAQTQLRIDSVTWDVAGDAFTLNVRNTGSVEATLESVSIRLNKSGEVTSVAPTLISIANGEQKSVTPGTFAPAVDLDYSTSYVIRVTANTGFYYEAVFMTGAAPG